MIIIEQFIERSIELTVIEKQNVSDRGPSSAVQSVAKNELTGLKKGRGDDVILWCPCTTIL